jgi:GxxExxY protein
MNDVDAISADVVDEPIRIHRELGPGLLESVYETVLAAALARRGYKIDRQKPVDIRFDGMTFAAAFRVDIQIDDQVSGKTQWRTCEAAIDLLAPSESALRAATQFFW